MLLSIIIPVYNCAHLIKRCINSIISQDIDDYEIIIVNDGSKDDSEKICNELAKVYNVISVISQENRGTATARNIGLNHSSGKYVWFIDADDFIPASSLRPMIRRLSTDKYNIVTFNYDHLLYSGIQHKILYSSETDIKSTDFLNNSPCMFAATKIYSRKILGNIHFKDGLKNIEDFLFNIEIFAKDPMIHTLPICGYFYDNTNENSTSMNRSLRNLVKLSIDSLIVHQTINMLLTNLKDDDLHNSIQNQLNYSIAGHIYSLIKYYNIKRLKKVLWQYKSIGLYPVKKTNNLRADFFIAISNHKLSLFIVAYFYKLKNLIK